MLLVAIPLALPSSQVALANHTEVLSVDGLRERHGALMGQIVAVRGKVTEVRERRYVVDGMVSASIRGVDWPLRVGDPVVIRGYLTQDPQLQGGYELKHPFLAKSPRRTAAEVGADPGAYHMRFVEVTGRVTSVEPDGGVLDGKLAVEGLSRFDEPLREGAAVVLWGQALKPGSGDRLPRLGSARVVRGDL